MNQIIKTIKMLTHKQFWKARNMGILELRKHCYNLENIATFPVELIQNGLDTCHPLLSNLCQQPAKSRPIFQFHFDISSKIQHEISVAQQSQCQSLSSIWYKKDGTRYPLLSYLCQRAQNQGQSCSTIWNSKDSIRCPFLLFLYFFFFVYCISPQLKKIIQNVVIHLLVLKNDKITQSSKIRSVKKCELLFIFFSELQYNFTLFIEFIIVISILGESGSVQPSWVH